MNLGETEGAAIALEVRSNAARDFLLGVDLLDAFFLAGLEVAAAAAREDEILPPPVGDGL